MRVASKVVTTVVHSAERKVAPSAARRAENWAESRVELKVGSRADQSDATMVVTTAVLKAALKVGMTAEH